ncbi:hypothetical protein [Actinoplanes palleronii]|uniref:hypothetical protein n=1 Tax=Actinoplanes palleronii TaxID=113570 RepID=UPI00194453C2|nr:hypothetical protein [Actinoplanes palleronii]
MAFRSWVKLLAATALAAAVIGAGQLGIAYGLGVVRLDRILDVTARDQWTAQLAWVAWITMTAAAIGATIATGLRPRWLPRPVGGGGALGVGIAAGLGSLAVLPLTMQPARAAQVAGVQPVFVIGLAAGLGAAAGIFAGWAAAAKPAARWNVAALSSLMWIVALVSVVPSLLPGHTPIAIRLGVLSGSLIPAAVAGHTAFLTMPTLALLAGLAVGWAARGNRLPTLAVGLAGLAGPALLTVAYLIAGPEGAATGFRADPYWSAMTACGAGVLGSVLVAIVRGAPATTASSAPAAAPVSQPPSVREEEDPPPALPHRDAPAQSAIAQASAAAAVHPADTGVIATAAGTPNNPFSGGTGSPFRSGAPFPPAPVAAPYPTHPAPTPYPSHPAPTPNQAPPQAPAPENPPRFSGQQPTPASGGRGWRSRGKATPPPPPPAPGADSFNGFTAGPPSGRSGSVTAEQPRVPAPRGSASHGSTSHGPASHGPASHGPASHGPVVEPTSISGPHGSGPGRKPRQETDYVDWVSGLGGQ